MKPHLKSKIRRKIRGQIRRNRIMQALAAIRRIDRLWGSSL